MKQQQRRKQEEQALKVSRIYQQNPYKMNYQLSPKMKALKQAS